MLKNDPSKGSYSSANRLHKSNTTRLTPSGSRGYGKAPMSSSHRLSNSALRSKQPIASPMNNKSPNRTPVSATRR